MRHHPDVRNLLARGVAGALPVAVLVAFAGVASAAPAQPGNGAEPQPPASQPGVTIAPVAPPNSPQVREDEAAPSTDYGSTRPAPQARYEAPVNFGRLHAPVAVRPVAPVRIPKNALRLGELTVQLPRQVLAVVPQQVRNEINITAANLEAQVTTAARSVGISPARADHAAGVLAEGAGIGALVSLGGGAVMLAGVPVGAVIGGVAGTFVFPLIGTVIGAVVGMAIGAAVSTVATAPTLAGLPLGLLGGAIGGGASLVSAR